MVHGLPVFLWLTSWRRHVKHWVHININNYYDLWAYLASMLRGTFVLNRIISCDSHWFTRLESACEIASVPLMWKFLENVLYLCISWSAWNLEVIYSPRKCLASAAVSWFSRVWVLTIYVSKWWQPCRMRKWFSAWMNCLISCHTCAKNIILITSADLIALWNCAYFSCLIVLLMCLFGMIDQVVLAVIYSEWVIQ
jgi:hypothetical protein